MPDPQTPPAGVTEIEAPDGTVIEFPSSMGDVEITAAMQKLYPPVTQTPPGKPLAPPVSTASPSTSVAGNGVAASNGVGQKPQGTITDEAGDVVITSATKAIPPQPQLAPKPTGPFVPSKEQFKEMDRQVKQDLLATTKNLGSLPFLQFEQYQNTADPTGTANVPLQDTRRQYVMDDLMESLPEHRKTYIQSKIAQDKWTDADAAALEMEAVARAAKVVDARISILEDRVKAGEKVPDAEIEDIMAHAKYVDKEASGQFAEIVRRHPEVARERLDDIAKSKASTARLATTPQAYIVEPAIRAAAQFGANILRTPRTFSFNDEYGWTDQLAEHAEKVMGRSYAQQPESLKGDLVTKDAEGNYSVSGEKLLPKTVETLVSSLMMVGAGGGTPAGLIGSSFVQTNADYYKDAINEGASSSDAGKYAASAASVTSALELISPQNYLFNKAVRDMGKQAVKEMVKGETLSEAMKKSLFVLKEVGGENLQEMSQLAADKVMAGIANTALSADNPYFSGALDDQFKPEELAETITLTTAMSGIMSGVAVTGKNPLNAEAVKWAVDNSEEFVKSMEKYGVPKDQQQTAVEKLAAYKKAFGGFKETGDASKDVTIAEAVIKKDEIKQKQTENPVDDLIAMVQGNKWEKQLEEQDKIIADELGIDLVEVAKKQEADKLREQYDKAKLKSEITGKPMPEGMTKPKEVKLEPKAEANTREVGLNTTPSDGVDTDALGFAVNDIAASVEDGKKYGVASHDGSVTDEDQTLDVIDADYGRIRALSEKGKLTKEALVKTSWGRALSTSDLGRVADALNNNPDLVDKVFSDIESRLKNTTTTNETTTTQVPESTEPTPTTGRQQDGSLNKLPRKFKVDGKDMEASHWKPAEDVARSYMEKVGLPYNPPTDYVKVDPARAKLIADEYEKMKHDPDDPEVRKAFETLANEVSMQFEEMMASGLSVDMIERGSEDPYKGNPRLSTEDIRNNNHVWVYPSDAGYGPYTYSDRAAYMDAMDAARSAMPEKERLSVSPIPDDFDGRLFLHSSGKAGFGISSDGELVGLFKAPGGPRGVAKESIEIGKGLGATHLWAFDGGLTDLYSKYGASEVDRVKWNDEYAPSGWDKKEMGSPDVVKMSLDGVTPPLSLEKTKFMASGRQMTNQEVFRAVHDYFGHVKEGLGFRADGEENAWRSHSSMLSPDAQRALTTLTRGQNSWVNFGPHGEKNRTASGNETVYAEQKIGLMPKWVSDGGDPISEPSIDPELDDLLDIKRQDGLLQDAGDLKNGRATEGVNLVPKKLSKHLTDDGNGNYVFFHTGPKKLEGGKIDPNYFGTRASKDNRYNPVMNYYTKPEHGENTVRNDVSYAVPVPKWKVYPLMTDPLKLRDQAKANFHKKFGDRMAFDYTREADFIGPLAVKAGFDMMIAGWSMHPLRAESPKALKPSKELTKKYEDEITVDLTATKDPYYEKLMAKLRKERDKADARLAKDEGDGSVSTTAPRMTKEKATNLLKKVAPGVTVITHKDQPSLSKAYARNSGRNVLKSETATTKGFYDPIRKEIHIGPFASDTTMAHEAMHPLFRAAFTEKAGAVKNLYNELLKDPDLAPYVEHGNKPSYKAKGEAMVHEEAIVQFMAAVYEGKLDEKFKKDKNFLQKVRDFIKDIMTKMGLRKNEINFSSIEDLKQMAGLIQEAVRTGGAAVAGEVKGDMSAGVAMQEDADRLVDGWYSRLDQAVAAKGNTQSGADWMKWAEARAKEGMLSMEEVKWTGLADFLQGKAKATPQEVRDFLKENRVKVEVKEIGTPRLSKDDLDMFFTGDGFKVEAPGVGVRGVYVRLDQLDVEYDGENMAEIESLARDEALAEIVQNEDGGDTKFSQYQLPGGTNYREVLVTLPVSKSISPSTDIRVSEDGRWGVYDKQGRRVTSYATESEAREHVSGLKSVIVPNEEKFRSSHFDEPNILVHLRLNDRTDADGKKVLFIEELQSDWGQKGKKEGFYSPLTKAEQNELRSLRERTYASEKYPLSEAETKRANELISREGGPQFKGLPSAPFVTDTNSWVELGLKQAIRMAVDGGYDRIAWTHGQVHTDRWGTERIEWAKQNDGSFLVNAKSQHGGNAGGVDLEGAANAQNLNQENSNTVSSREELEEAIRPSLTEGQDAKKLSEKLWTKMQADDSGMSMPRKEGFEGFYDKILPNVAKKVSKKLGGDGKVGEVEFTKGESRWVVTPPDSNIPYWQSTSKTEAEAHAKKTNGVVRRPSADLTQQSIEITDAMRDKAGLGVPLMARGTPQEIADAFKKKGYTDQKAREYMDNAGVDEQTIKDVMDAMKPAKPEPPERKKIPEGRKERESAERLRHDDPELYKLLSADDISYEKIPEKNKISLKTAEDMVRVLGPEKALLAVKDRNNGMPEAVRTYMARMIPKVFEEKGDMTAAKNAVNEMLELAASEASGLQAFRGFANSKEAYIPSIVMVNTRKMIEDIIEKKMGDTKAGRYQRKKYEKTKKALEDLNKEAVDTVLRGAEVNRVKNKAAAPQQTTSSKERIKKAWDWDNNKVVKKERKAEILKALRGTFGTGPNPLYVELAAGYMEAGARTFAAVAEEVSRELGRKAVPYFKEAYKKAFGYLKERGVDAGEPDTDAQINEVIANVNAKELVDQLKKALAKNDQKTSAEILAKLQEQSKSMDAWGAYRDYAVEKLERMANQEIADARLRNDAMREFTDGLVRNMSAQMREEEKSKGVPPKEKPAEKSDIQIIGEAFKNFEKYKEVWSKTQNEFKARLRAAEARLEKADTPIAKEEAQQAIEKETARLEKLDAYFGDLMLKPFSEVGLGRAVKAGLKDLGQKIDTIVRQHYTVGEGVRRSLQEKLVTEAGLTNEAAKVLSDAVGKEFDKLTKARREKIIEQYLGRHAVDRVKKERSKSTDADKVTLLENIGALSDEDFLHAYAEANGWPAFTEETAKELKRLADLIQTSPKGRPRNEAIADLLTYQANLPGVTKWDLLGGIWYANMLSGYNTQTVNVFANIFRVVAEYDVAAIRATASGHPGDAKHLAKAMAYGLLRGLPEFTSTLRTGYSPIRGRVEEKGVMERKRFSGAAYPLNALKYVSRFMKAADVLAYEPLRELRAYQLAIKDAREEGGPTERQRQRALEILNRDNTSLKEAAKQAREEYEAEILSITSGFSKKYQDLGKEATKEQKEELRKKESQAIKKANLDRRRRVYELVQEGRSTDMLERSARFAQASTYNSPPPGAFGVVARAINGMIRELPVLKYMIPFVNVITNVLHDGMNYYMGAGIIRAARGGSVFKAGKDNEKLSQAERDDLRADYFVKGVIGVVTMVALMLLSGDDDDDLEITADGHGNWADNAVLRRSGWMPYSIRLPGTKTYISYQYTPLVLSLGFVGHFRDAQKYRKEKIDDKFYTQAAVAFSRNMSTGADMSFLSNTSDLLSNIVDDRNENKVGDATSGVMKIIKRTMIPALYDEAAKNMEAAFKMPEKEVRGTLMGQFLKDIPYARGMYEDKYDAFGPVIPNGNPFRRFVSIKDEQDPLIHLMVDKDFSMKAPHPGTLTVINDDGDERVMTDQERRFFYDQRAMIIREEVDGMYDELQSMDKKEFAEEMSKIQSYATYSAKALIEY